MSINVWQKRRSKIKGFLNQIYSYGLLRHTPLQTAVLKKQIVNEKIDRCHVGCGYVQLDGWLNVLYEKREEYGRLIRRGKAFVLNYNLLAPWPVPDETIRFVAGSHFIEHLDLNDGIQFLKECRRVIKSGGLIRLSCPDLEIYARHYVDRNQDFFNQKLIHSWG